MHNVQHMIGVVALTAATVLSAQQSHPTFRTATEIVPVHVTVRTNAGEIVRGLTARDFDVFDNGSRREILTFSSDPVPVSVAILLDRSGSLDAYAPQVAQAGDAFLDHLLPGDRVSVQTLATDCQPLTTDFSLVRDVIAAGLPSDPGSAIWAALDRTVSLFPDTTSRRAVLLVTDGENDSGEGLLRQTNSASRPLPRCRYLTPVTPFAMTANGVARHIERDGVLVYAIGISEGSGSTLGRVASRSGGRRYGTDNLAAAFTEIADELHRQYLLGFAAAPADGKAHEIDVRVERSGVVVRARKAYFTGPAFASGYGEAGRGPDSAWSMVLSDQEIADAIANTNRDRARVSCVLEKLAPAKDRPSPPPAAVLLRSPRARIADAAREAALAGLPFTAADVLEDLRLRVVEMSMAFEIPSAAPLTRMWVVSHESEPVGLPPRTLVTLANGHVSARFDAAAFAKFPIVPLDLVVKNGSQVRRCTIPVAAVRDLSPHIQR
jgi:VWFA-related protein